MEDVLDNNKFILFKIPGCPNCIKLSNMFDFIGLQSKYVVININEIDHIEYNDILDFLEKTTNTRSFPMVFMNKKYIGNYNSIKDRIDLGTFGWLLKQELGIDTEINV